MLQVALLAVALVSHLTLKTNADNKGQEHQEEHADNKGQEHQEEHAGSLVLYTATLGACAGRKCSPVSLMKVAC